jgi:tetratricopeptide (TPR) repeat protein
LAIELAAVRAGVLTPAQMLDQIQNRFDLLVSRRRDAPRRHRSLRAALDWSYQLLPPELQRFFARLSVFRGGWTVAAAATVCDESAALDYLERLRECSLVGAEQDGDEIRYRMLDTLREYGVEQLTPLGLADVRRRHACYYLALAEEVERPRAGADTPAWLSRLQTEHDNMRAALEWAVERGAASDPAEGAEGGGPDPVQLGLRLTGALEVFWHARGCFPLAEEQISRLLSLPGAQNCAAERARVLSMMAALRGNYAAVQEWQEESLAIRQEIHDRDGVATSLQRLGCVAEEAGDFKAARAYFEGSRAIFGGLGDRRGIASVLKSLGLVAEQQGDYEEAYCCYRESLDIRRELGDWMGIAVSLHKLGDLALERSDYEGARRLQEQSLGIWREAGHRPGTAYPLHGLGKLEQAQGHYEVARRYFEEGLAIRREIGERHGIAMSHWALAQVAEEQGEYEAAGSHYRESLRVRRELGDKRGIALSLWGLARVAQRQGDHTRARKLHAESLAIRRALRVRPDIAASLHALGEMAEEQGQHGRARKRHAMSLRIRRALGNKRGIAESLAGLAGVAAGMGQHERAARLFGAAAALRATIGAPLPPCDHEEQARRVATVRAGLGEGAFAGAWARGEAMTLKQAVNYALETNGMGAVVSPI